MPTALAVRRYEHVYWEHPQGRSLRPLWQASGVPIFLGKGPQLSSGWQWGVTPWPTYPSCPHPAPAHRHTGTQHVLVGVYPRHPYAQDSTEAQDGVWGHSCTHSQLDTLTKGRGPQTNLPPRAGGQVSAHRHLGAKAQGGCRGACDPLGVHSSRSGVHSGPPGPGRGWRPGSHA